MAHHPFIHFAVMNYEHCASCGSAIQGLSGAHKLVVTACVSGVCGVSETLDAAAPASFAGNLSRFQKLSAKRNSNAY
jgi:hypothetical protein